MDHDSIVKKELEKESEELKTEVMLVVKNRIRNIHLLLYKDHEDHGTLGNLDCIHKNLVAKQIDEAHLRVSEAKKIMELKNERTA